MDAEDSPGQAATGDTEDVASALRMYRDQVNAMPPHSHVKLRRSTIVVAGTSSSRCLFGSYLCLGHIFCSNFLRFLPCFWFSSHVIILASPVQVSDGQFDTHARAVKCLNVVCGRMASPIVNCVQMPILGLKYSRAEKKCSRPCRLSVFHTFQHDTVVLKTVS